MKPKSINFLALSGIITAAGAITFAALPSNNTQPPMYQTEALQAGYANEYLFGATGCEGADDPSEVILGVTREQLADSGCTTIFEL